MKETNGGKKTKGRLFQRLMASVLSVMLVLGMLYAVPVQEVQAGGLDDGTHVNVTSVTYTNGVGTDDTAVVTFTTSVPATMIESVISSTAEGTGDLDFNTWPESNSEYFGMVDANGQPFTPTTPGDIPAGTYTLTSNPVAFTTAGNSYEGPESETTIYVGVLIATSTAGYVSHLAVEVPAEGESVTVYGGDPNDVAISIPTATTPVYNGSVQTGVADGTGYVVTGGTAINVGTYIATCDLLPGYKWSDGTYDAKRIPWSITKALSVIVKKPIGITNLKYSGTPRVLVTAGETKHGVMKYAVKIKTSTKKLSANKSEQIMESSTVNITMVKNAPADLSWSTELPTATDPGTYTVWYMVAGDANHSDSTPESVDVTIADESATFSMDNCTIDAISDKNYTGKAIKPTVKVRCGDIVLKKGTDYILYYNNNKLPGKATVTVVGEGDYSGSVKTTFKIYGKISDAKVAKINDQGYTKKAVTPVPNVTFAGELLKNKTDYSLSYKNNVKKGTATVIIKGKGYYSGTKKVTFRIVKKTSFKKGKVKVTLGSDKNSSKKKDGSYNYNGSAIKPAVIKVTYNGNTLVKDRDFKVAYFDNTNAGKAYLEIQGINTYCGTYTENFTINKIKWDFKLKDIKRNTQTKEQWDSVNIISKKTLEKAGLKNAVYASWWDYFNKKELEGSYGVVSVKDTKGNEVDCRHGRKVNRKYSFENYNVAAKHTGYPFTPRAWTDYDNGITLNLADGFIGELRVKVRFYADENHVTTDKTIYVTINPTKNTKITKIANVSGKKIEVTMKDIGNPLEVLLYGYSNYEFYTVKYETQYSKNSNYKYADSVETEKPKATIKGLKKGTTYYVRSRVLYYNKFEEKWYPGKWTDSNKIKVKK